MYNKWDILYIVKVDEEDAYSRYNFMGVKVEFNSYVNSRYSYDKGREEDYISAYLNILEGEYANKTLHFFKVKLSRSFPFIDLMEEALDGK